MHFSTGHLKGTGLSQVHDEIQEIDSLVGDSYLPLDQSAAVATADWWEYGDCGIVETMETLCSGGNVISLYLFRNFLYTHVNETRDLKEVIPA